MLACPLTRRRSRSASPANRLTSIIYRKRGISADTAMRLGRFFGTSAEMWINLQARYDLQAAEDELWARIAEV